MNDAADQVASITIKLNELRSKREQTAKTFESIIIVLHVLTLAVFGIMNKLTSIFFELIGSIDATQSAFALSPIDPVFMNQYVAYTSSNDVSSKLHCTQGCPRWSIQDSIFPHCIIGSYLGSITAFAMNEMLASFLEESILDLGRSSNLVKN